jgi:hypothetical protein
MQQEMLGYVSMETIAGPETAKWLEGEERAEARARFKIVEPDEV